MKEILQKQKLIFDGAFGTYYALVYDTKELPELANTLHPERVRRIHREYIEAGAQIIRTNTFAVNTFSLDVPWDEVQENIRRGYRLAVETVQEWQAQQTDAADKKVYIAADIGQIPYDHRLHSENISEEYVKICRTFLEEGAEIFVFETFSDIDDIREAINLIGEKAFVIVQFSVNQFGYSHSGLSARKLMERAEKIECVDAVGFNCGVGPGHMQHVIRHVTRSGRKFLTALPNAGYPQIISNRMIFDDSNIDYFASKV